MADPTDAPTPVFRCQWCSAPLPSEGLETCPSCGATLTSTSGADALPGVTTLDTEAILRARSTVSRPRSRLLSFITGETDDGSTTLTPGSAESLAPPSEDVRREMLRMELAAEVADLEAEVQSLETEARFESGRPLSAADAAAADAATAEATLADGTPAETQPATAPVATAAPVTEDPTAADPADPEAPRPV